MHKDGMQLEFFKYPDLDPALSSFSCCLRMDDLDGFYQMCRKAGIPEQPKGSPRLHPPAAEHSGLTIGYMVDLDGTLLRLIQNS